MVSWIGQLPQLASAAVILALAGTLLALRLPHPATRPLALLLCLRAFLTATYSFGLLAANSNTAHFWWHLFPIFLLPLPFVALHFGLVYPGPRGRWGRSRWTAPFLTLASLLLVAAYMLQPTLFWDLDSDGTDPRGPDVDTVAGPLFAFEVLFLLAFALLAFVFARDYVRSAPGPHRTNPLLVSFGFSVVVLYNGLSIPAFAPELLWRHAPLLSALMTGALGLALVMIFGLAAYLLLAIRRATDYNVHERLRIYLVLLPLPVASVGLLLLVPAEAHSATLTMVYLFSSAWRLALPVVVAYALVRHHLFDIDLKMKGTIRRGTLAFLFLGCFLVAAQLAQNAFAEALGWAIGGVAAGLLLFALSPLQRLAERLADAALPHTRPVQELDKRDRLALYREQLYIAWSDGALSIKDRRLLEAARSRLGLAADDVLRLEQEVMQTWGPPNLGMP